jgi:hypothetical protein
LLPKLVYILFNAVILGAAIYKFSGKLERYLLMINIVMGIIPVAPYDWVGLISTKVPMEHS